MTPKYEVTVGTGFPMYFHSMHQISKVLGFSREQIQHALLGFPLKLIKIDKDVYIKRNLSSSEKPNK